MGGGKIKFLYLETGDLRPLLPLIGFDDIDVFYHLAWEGGTKNAEITFEQQIGNIEMSTQWLKFAKELGCRRFVGAGSVNENLAYQWPLANHPRILYAATKDYVSKVLAHMAQLSPEIEFVWCRLASTYGKFDASNNLVNYTVKQLLAGYSPEYSTALEPYNFCYIRDCVEALKIIGVSEYIPKKPVFIGGPETAPLRELLTIIQRSVAPDIPLKFGVRPSDGVVYKAEWFSVDMLKNLYGFIPRYSLSKGISELLDGGGWAYEQYG